MESQGENPVYILFDRDWGGEDLEDNGVAVLVEDMGKCEDTNWVEYQMHWYTVVPKEYVQIIGDYEK